MAVSHDAVSESHTGTTGSTNESSFSWTHTPSGTPRGVWVAVMETAVTDYVSSVTYGGTAMSRVSGALATDTAGEVGRCEIFFLGESVPTGAQTVQVNRTNNATILYAVCATVAAAADCEVYGAGIVLAQENGTLAEQSVNDGSPGTNSVRYAVGFWGGSTTPAAGANSTAIANLALGTRGFAAVRESTAGQGSRSVGFNTGASSDDRAIVYFAVREKPATIHDVTVSETVATTSSQAPTWSGDGAVSETATATTAESNDLEQSAAASETVAATSAESSTWSGDGAVSESAAVTDASSGSTPAAGVSMVRLPRGIPPRRQPRFVELDGASPLFGGLWDFLVMHGRVPVSLTGALVSPVTNTLTARAFADGFGGNADGSQWLRFNIKRPLQLTKGYTFVIHANVGATWDTWGGLFCLATADGATNAATIQKDNAGTPANLCLTHSSGALVPTGAPQWKTTELTHATRARVFVVRWTPAGGANGTFRFWIDGKASADTAHSSQPLDNPGRLLFFAERTASASYNASGVLFSCSIWQRALPDGRCRELSLDPYAPFASVTGRNLWFGTAGAPTTHNATAAESVGATSAESGAQDTTGAVAETTGTTSAQSANQDTTATVAETAAIVDARSATWTGDAAVSIALSVTTAEAGALAMDGTVAETVATTSSQAQDGAAVSTLGESIGATSGESLAASWAVLAAFQLAATDTDAAVATFEATAAETVAATSSQAQDGAIALSVAETVGTTTSEAATWSGSLTVAESVAGQSLEAVAAQFVAAVAETVAQVSAQAAGATIDGAIAETIGTTSPVAVSLTLTGDVAFDLGVFDLVGATSNTSAAVVFNAALAEQVAAAIAYQVGAVESVAIVEQVDQATFAAIVGLPDGRTLTVRVEARTRVVDVEARTFTVRAEQRRATVEQENRTVEVSAESRTFTIH